MRRLLALSLLATTLPAHAGTLRVVSWNLRHEGWSGETDFLGDAEQIWFEFGSASTSPNGCDVVFLQEVMDVTVPAKIAAELAGVSGVAWTSAVSPLVGRSTYREAYAVLWRPDRVSVESAKLWTDTGDRFEREPYVVRVREVASKADYTFLDWHAVFGTTSQRQAEVKEIAVVFQAVQAADAADQDVILLGDHNADANSTWWTALKGLTPAVTFKVNDRTTINSTGGWASAYDHFWYQASYVTEAGTGGRDYVQDPLVFVQDVSDHAPVWLKLYATADTD